jgi:hypothetical protein
VVADEITVLHPFLGMPRFRKMGEERANNAKTLFEVVYGSYNKTHEKQRTRKASTPPTRTSNFLDDVCMLDVDEETLTPQTEVERFYLAA